MMKRILRKLSPARRERGQSLVELAISLTIMLLLLSGAVTFGMALFSYVALRDAAQEGALFGSFNPYLDNNPTNAQYDTGELVNQAAIRTRVREASNSPVNLASTTLIPDSYITIDTTPAGAPPCEGLTTDPSTGSQVPNGIQVTIEYDYPIIMPYVGGIIGSQHIHLRATVTDTILQPACP
jgi:hypothetical protein